MTAPTSPTSVSSYTSTSSSSSSPSNTAPTPPRTTSRPRVSAEHTLTRVRENQRRHRARRKDYIASLESRLALAETQLADARAEIALLRREREREREQMGESRTHIVAAAATTQSFDADAALHSEALLLSRLIDGLPTPVLGETIPTFGTQLHALALPPPDTPPSVPSSPADALALTIPITTGPPPCCDDTPSPSPSPSPLPSPECSSCHERPAPAPTESTTLCAQAYVLIAQQNFRGIDAGTIRLWLGQGYRRARREGEGCRVENGALFRLLDYISGV